MTVVVGADIFRNCTENGAQPVGSELWIVNKQELLAGVTTPHFTTYGPDVTISSIALGGSFPGDYSESDNCPLSPATLPAGSRAGSMSCGSCEKTACRW